MFPGITVLIFSNTLEITCIDKILELVSDFKSSAEGDKNEITELLKLFKE